MLESVPLRKKSRTFKNAVTFMDGKKFKTDVAELKI